MTNRKPATKTRLASDNRSRVCVSCHKLPKFCKCAAHAPATCPICKGLESEGEHFPKVDCYRVKIAQVAL